VLARSLTRGTASPHLLFHGLLIGSDGSHSSDPLAVELDAEGICSPKQVSVVHSVFLVNADSASMSPSTSQQWIVREQGDIDGLVLEDVNIPKPGDYEVLLKIHAVSLNFRDVMIATVMTRLSMLFRKNEANTTRAPTCGQRRTRSSRGS
jgi:hypothetical protein